MNQKTDNFKTQLHSLATGGPLESIEATRRQDKTWSAVGLAVLVGFIASPSITNFTNPVIKWLFIAAFVFTLAGELLIAWRYQRLPIRIAMVKKVTEKTANMTGDMVDTLLEAYVVPLAKYEERERMMALLSKAKNKEEADSILLARKEELMNHTDTTAEEKSEIRKKADSYLSSLGIFVLMTGINSDFEKSFKKPLNEKRAKVKHRLDRLAEKMRKPIFVFGMTLTIMSVLLDLMSK